MNTDVTQRAGAPSERAHAGMPPGAPAPDPSTGEAGPRAQYLTLTVGAERFAVALGSVLEILQVGTLTPLPMTPPFVRGVMNLRGSVVPVLDLNARFGRARATLSRRSCIVIVQVDGGEDEVALQPMGLLVDAVQEVLAVPDDDLEPVPPIGNRVAPELLSRIARVRGSLCPVLALERVLDVALLARLIGAYDREAAGTHRHPLVRPEAGTSGELH